MIVIGSQSPGREDRWPMWPMALRLHICDLYRHRPCEPDRLVVHLQQRRAFMRPDSWHA